MKVSSFFLILFAAAVLMALLFAQAPPSPVDEIPVQTGPAPQAGRGWQERDGQRYYLDDAGIPLTGWQTVEDRLYYFRQDGSMARGRVEIDGVDHFFTADGAEILFTNVWNPMPEGYTPERGTAAVPF